MRKLLLILVLIFASCNQSNTSNAKPNHEDENLQLYNKAEKELQNRNFTEAIKYYNKVIENSSIKNSYVVTMSYINRGVAKGELTDNRGAVSDFSYVINNGNISNLMHMPYHMRGIAKMRLDDMDGACFDWSKAGELGNDSAYNLIKEFCN